MDLPRDGEAPHLTITETNKRGERNYRTRLVITAEHLADFERGLREALTGMAAERRVAGGEMAALEPAEASKRDHADRSQSNRYEPWTNEGGGVRLVSLYDNAW